jgi:taurine dioxygenase
MTSLNCIPLDAPFGVEVTSVDLAGPLDPIADELRALFDAHSLLLVRDCSIDADALVRLGRVFGRVSDDRGDGTYHTYISNTRTDGRLAEGHLPFHSDFMYTRHPYPLIALQALEASPDAAPTRYVSCVRAAAELPAALRERVAPLQTCNASDHTDRHAYHERVNISLLDDAPESIYPRALYPVIDHHPRTGVELLTVGHYHTSHLVDVDTEEGDELLEEMWSILYAPANTYEHHWRTGDLVVWDNLALQHGRPEWPVTAARNLRRICVCEEEYRDMLAGSDLSVLDGVSRRSGTSD